MNWRSWLEEYFCRRLACENKELKNSLVFATHSLKRAEEKLACCEQPRYIFSEFREVSGDELRKALYAAHPTLKSALILDTVYHAVTWEELKEWLAVDSLDKMRWVANIHDCDDFAMESMCRMRKVMTAQGVNIPYRPCMGDTTMGYHMWDEALCIMEDDSLKIIVIEPQNDDTRLWSKSDYKTEVFM